MTPSRSRTLLGDLRQLIAEARQDVARQVNSALVMLYWRVGKRIRQDILKEKRAEYGERIASALGTQLGWTHFRQTIYLDDPLKRDFYTEMCRNIRRCAGIPGCDNLSLRKWLGIKR